MNNMYEIGKIFEYYMDLVEEEIDRGNLKPYYETEYHDDGVYPWSILPDGVELPAIPGDAKDQAPEK